MLKMLKFYFFSCVSGQDPKSDCQSKVTHDAQRAYFSNFSVSDYQTSQYSQKRCHFHQG